MQSITLKSGYLLYKNSAEDIMKKRTPLCSKEYRGVFIKTSGKMTKYNRIM